MARRIVANNALFDEVALHIAAGHQVEIPTKGNSMLPFIRGGKDTVTLSSADNLDVGSIVLAKIDDKRYVLHRVISISGDQVTLMGDGNIRGCEHCTISQIHAKVQYIIRNGKQIDPTSKKERRRAQIWFKIRPLRRYILAIWRRVGGL